MEARKLRPGETGGYWGKQGFGGYPGVKHTARQIVEYIPVREIYVEPFAGLGRTAEFIEAPFIILNDKSDFAFSYLKKQFPQAIVTQNDFMTCIDDNDTIRTVFFIDPPWLTSVYDENDLTFCDRKDVEYYAQLFNRFKTMKGDWIIASSVESKTGKMMYEAAEKNDWHIKLIESRKKVILGKKARTLLMSNKPFEKHRASSVKMDDFL